MSGAMKVVRKPSGEAWENLADEWIKLAPKVRLLQTEILRVRRDPSLLNNPLTLARFNFGFVFEDELEALEFILGSGMVGVRFPDETYQRATVIASKLLDILRQMEERLEPVLGRT